MIIGLGMDLIEISRIEESIARFGERFLSRVFTDTEIRYCQSKKSPAIHYAARFAAKEACAKAIGSGIAGGVKWLDIELIRDGAGQPTLKLTGHARKLADDLDTKHIKVTLTHTSGHAAAVVIFEGP